MTITRHLLMKEEEMRGQKAVLPELRNQSRKLLSRSDENERVVLQRSRGRRAKRKRERKQLSRRRERKKKNCSFFHPACGDTPAQKKRAETGGTCCCLLVRTCTCSSHPRLPGCSVLPGRYPYESLLYLSRNSLVYALLQQLLQA